MKGAVKLFNCLPTEFLSLDKNMVAVCESRDKTARLVHEVPDYGDVDDQAASCLWSTSNAGERPVALVGIVALSVVAVAVAVMARSVIVAPRRGAITVGFDLGLSVVRFGTHFVGLARNECSA